MGSATSTPTNNEDQSENPWWPIENTNFSLNGPNLSQTAESDSEKIPKNSERTLLKSQSDCADQVQSDRDCDENQIKINKTDADNTLIRKEQSLEEFKEELRIKRIARQGAMADLRNEIIDLRQQLANEREVNRKLRNGEVVEIEKNDIGVETDISIELNNVESSDNNGPSTSLRSQLAEIQLALQLANADNLSLTTELGVVRKQVTSLKEVITCSKEMIKIREEQVNQLKGKLREIEESLAERELKILSDNLRQEYDRQLANIRNLRQLYEERARVNAAEQENLNRRISIKEDELAAEIEKTKNLEERVSGLETDLDTSNKDLSSFKIQCADLKYENKELKEEMAAINKLFSQMLMGFNGNNNLDIDRLTTMLEENRSLLNEMATTEGNSEGACLPKLLFDIVKQANTEGDISIEEKCESDEQKKATNVVSAQEIIGNLPKVWRVLMELLNHHKIEQVQIQENGESEDCYKSVQTPTGPKVELSVSKTYIKLKDLILEKKSLQKETTKLKTLNSHLERRLHEQEKRLSTVSLELTKTWHLVGKMQRQHRQLHTHEQILRYQLQQKRRLLNELKDELEYCRRKWNAARAKNDESQIQCDDLRKEFASRKIQDANNSAESGYSDGPPSDEDDIITPKRNLHAMFERSKKIERVHSQSPTRLKYNDIIRRGNSTPNIAAILTELVLTTSNMSDELPFQNVAASSIVLGDEMATATVAPSPNKVETASGTVPKQSTSGVRLSRSKRKGEHNVKKEPSETLEEMYLRLSGVTKEEATLVTLEEANEKRADRAVRIQKLEEQCKSLIAQVMETSNCREELNEHLTRFQQELVPSPVPIEASVSTVEESAAKSYLTANEEEYTARRAARLRRLEEESKQLMSRIKKTTDRGKNMTSRLDHLHARCVSSREGSFDDVSDHSRSSQPRDDEGAHSILEDNVKLTPEEEAYTKRRAERITRLEKESKLLMNQLSSTAERSSNMETQLDALHTRYGPDQQEEANNNSEGAEVTEEILEENSDPEDQNN